MQRANQQKNEFHQKFEDDHKRVMEEAKKRTLAPIWAMFHRKTLETVLATQFGDTDACKKLAEYITAINNDLPVPKFDEVKESGQTQSNPVKPEKPPVI